MAYRKIPEGSIEIQTGLWLYSYTKTLGGTEYTFRQLYSSEGYCFYDLQDEYYDEEGNLIPEENILPSQRTYYQYHSLSFTRDVNDFVSVPVDPSYEIVNRPNNSVEA